MITKKALIEKKALEASDVMSALKTKGLPADIIAAARGIDEEDALECEPFITVSGVELPLHANITAADVLETFTWKHDGKMTGMASVSTSAVCNPACQARRASGDKCHVCPHCYAETLLNMRKGLGNKTVRNAAVWAGAVIPWDALPYINMATFRVEAFGDLLNPVHALNIARLIIKNRQTFFGWWTKNPGFISTAVKWEYLCHADIPNCNIIFSNAVLDTPPDVDAIRKKWAFIDKVFTVYTAAGAAENGIKINCSFKNCATCSNSCYKAGGVECVNELLKSEQTRLKNRMKRAKKARGLA